MKLPENMYPPTEAPTQLQRQWFGHRPEDETPETDIVNSEYREGDIEGRDVVEHAKKMERQRNKAHTALLEIKKLVDMQPAPRPGQFNWTLISEIAAKALP